MPLRATTTVAEPDLIFLPWEIALEDWPAELLVTRNRGISRHVVRFVRVNRSILAIKEMPEHVARREYGMLGELARLVTPCVEAVGVVAGRETPDGEELPAALVTRHLAFSLPYRTLMSRPDLTWPDADRLLDSLVLLLVRLHLIGFAWNDCSLSNTLFRRDAGALTAYLVDAETGELHEQLSAGQRQYDLETAVLNVVGELMDLEAGGLLARDLEPVRLAEQFRQRYEHLWLTLTEPVVVTRHDRFQIQTLLRTLNGLGFDVAELSIEATAEHGGRMLRVRPKVVGAGHHRMRMRSLTGLSMHENQARRLLNDMDSFRAVKGIDEEVAAHRWVGEVYEAVLERVPGQLRAKLEPAELVNEVLLHRWYSSERAGRDVGVALATDDYVARFLVTRADEAEVIDPGGADDGGDPDVSDEPAGRAASMPPSGPSRRAGQRAQVGSAATRSRA